VTYVPFIFGAAKNTAPGTLAADAMINAPQTWYIPFAGTVNTPVDALKLVFTLSNCFVNVVTVTLEPLGNDSALVVV